jgi:hypothetical protein
MEKKMKLSKRVQLVSLLALCSLVAMCSACGCNSKGKEKTKAGGAESSLTKDQLADAIEAHVDNESAKTNGLFIIEDEEIGEKLRMSLHKVHRDRLSRVGKDLYFACADFKAENGTMYDIDFFMTGTSKENLKFSEFSIHKVDGKERYTWHKKGDLWMRKPTVEKGEHPKGEHPSEHPE